MGTIKHDAMIITGDRPHLVPAHARAVALFQDSAVSVSEITSEGVNAYCSFMVAPDGSKEGWADSDACDELRDTYAAWLRRAPFIDWVHVQFGGDNGDTWTRVVAHSDDY